MHSAAGRTSPAERGRLPEVPGRTLRSKTQCTQTSDGAVPGGRPRYHSTALNTPAVPSKAECLSDMRLFQLVRDGTYNEVLEELEAAAPYDAEAAWIKTKLLRLVQRHRQRTYGSIRNPVTSRKAELTPDVTASAAPQNLDLQLPALERPPAEVVAARMMQDLAVLHNLQPRELTNTEIRTAHEKMFVQAEVYIEKELSQSRASSPLHASSPLLAMSPPQSAEHHQASTNSLAELSRGSTLAELSRGSTTSSKCSGQPSQSRRRNDPSFVNRKGWSFHPDMPANDGSRRDRRMNSPVGDKSGEWSRISYAPLGAPQTHGFWGSTWKHPQDIYKIKPGVDTHGIKTINSQAYGEISSLIQTLTEQLHSSSFDSSAGEAISLQDPPERGSVRNAQISAQREAETHVQLLRAVEQRKKMECESLTGPSTSYCHAHDNVDHVLVAMIQDAQEMWNAAVDAEPPLDGIDPSRREVAMNLLISVEHQGKKRAEEFKNVISDIWKADVIGAALLREETATLSIDKTLLRIEEHIAKLAAGRLDKAEKKVEVAELALQRAAQEASSHKERLDEEIHALQISSEKRAVVQAQRDELANEAAEYEKEVSRIQKEIAGNKEQMKTLEAEAYQHAQQGKAELVKEKKAKAEEFRTACTGLRATMERILEKLAKTRRKLDLVTADMIVIENLEIKDEVRVEETRKVCERDRDAIRELEEKVALEKSEALTVRQFVDERQARVVSARLDMERIDDGGPARVRQEDSGHSPSPVAVLDRLRSNSLALVAKMILSSEDPDVSTQEQAPVYLGERADGKRHGFGILQYPAGAGYVGEFQNDVPCGIGIERYADGTTYEGSFLRGERHGMGVYTIASRVAYLGLFRGGRRAGPGVICIAARSASLAYWPVVVCVCRADSFEAISAAKFRTDCLQNALLMTDVRMAQRRASENAKHARSMVLTHFFTQQEHSQIDSRHNMGLSVVPKNPSIQAFKGSDSLMEVRAAVSAKMHDVETIARLAATPGGRKAAKRVKTRSPMPFQKGEGRRHAASIYGWAPAGAAYYKT